MEPELTPYDAIGGDTTIARVVTTFYDVMPTLEPELAATHARDPDGRIRDDVRLFFTRFLCFWTGGPEDYLALRGHPRLRMRHAHVAIDSRMRDAWLHCMNVALDTNGVTGPGRAYLDRRFAEVADFLRNTPDPEPDAQGGGPARG